MTLVLAFFNRFQFDKSDVSSGCRLRGERACQNKSDREARIAPAMPMTAARKIAQLNCMIALNLYADNAIGTQATASMLQFDRLPDKCHRSATVRR